MEERCPECGSEDVIPWDDGCICRDCGYEFGFVILLQDMI